MLEVPDLGLAFSHNWDGLKNLAWIFPEIFISLRFVEAEILTAHACACAKKLLLYLLVKLRMAFDLSTDNLISPIWDELSFSNLQEIFLGCLYTSPK